MTPSVSVILVLYNSADTLPDCLGAIRDELDTGFAELIAVDNGSPDESGALARGLVPTARLERSAHNRGFAGGVNFGLETAGGRYWLLLNPDVALPPRGLEQLVDWLDAHPDYGMATPDLVDGEGRSAFPGRRLPSIAKSMLELSRLHLLLPPLVRGQLLLGHYRLSDAEMEAEYVPASAVLVRPRAVVDAGPLSPNVRFYGEDVEWCWRLRKAGWRIGVLASLKAIHLEGSSARRTWGEDERRRRIWRGYYDACRRIHGSTYTRVLIAVNALAFSVEILVRRLKRQDPRESADDLARIHRDLMIGRLSIDDRHEEARRT
jgi:hypothetical protein